MKINLGSQYQPIDAAAAERIYKASYVGDFCIKLKNGDWSEEPASIFYTENPDTSKGHKNYFGLFAKGNNVYITDATSVTEGYWDGLICEDTDEIIFSRFRHDYRTNLTGKYFVDGGRDYFRSNCIDKSQYVKLKINDGLIEVEYE